MCGEGLRAANLSLDRPGPDLVLTKHASNASSSLRARHSSVDVRTASLSRVLGDVTAQQAHCVSEAFAALDKLSQLDEEALKLCFSVVERLFAHTKKHCTTEGELAQLKTLAGSRLGEIATLSLKQTGDATLYLQWMLRWKS